MGLIGLVGSNEPRALAQTTHPANWSSPIGTNVHFFKDWVEEYSVVDVFKQSRPWITRCRLDARQPDCTAALTGDTGEEALLDLDEHGWVRTLPAPTDAPIYWRVATMMLHDHDGPIPSGQYVVLYDGEGTLEYGGDATKNLSLSVAGRDVLDVPAGSTHGIDLEIASTDPRRTGNYIRNIRVLMPGTESTYLAHPYNATFLARIAKYKVIRFMQWAETQNNQQVEWIDRPQLADARWTTPYYGVPIEAQVSLANEAHADAWFNVPHKASDAFITQFATLVRDSLQPGLKAYVEYSNEVWNDLPTYPQSQWVLDQANAKWPNSTASDSLKRQSWHGMRTAQICDLWKSVFGAQKDRVVCVMGSQGANPTLGTYALDCPLWTEGAPCWQHGIDALAIGGYFTIRVNDTVNRSEVLAWTTQADGGLNTLFDELLNGGHLTNGPVGGSLAALFEGMRGNKVTADARGIDLLVYEGGQHLYDQQQDPALVALFNAANRDPRMGTVYTRMLETWRDIGGKVFAHYVNVAASDTNGPFGALETMAQEHSPKYDALMSFIDANPCWWTCHCGDGILDAGEACDDGNLANGDCCSKSCAIEPSTTVCRAAVGACDAPDYCSGVDTTCGADRKSTAVCRPIADACDVSAETCSGVSDTCPPDGARRDCSSLTNYCGTGYCDAVLGCVATPLHEGQACDDGNAATVYDTCVAGTCQQYYPLPTFTSMTPSGVSTGSATRTITVNGTSFVSASQVTWAGAALATTYVSPTQLTATVPSTLLAAAGTFEVRVTSPGPGGGTSAARTFTVSNLQPGLTNLSPTAVNLNSATFTLTVAGYNFVSTSRVLLDGVALATTYVSSSTLRATVPATSLLTACYCQVTVNSPAPGGGNSSARTLRVDNPTPIFSTITPNVATAGSAALPVTIDGYPFYAGATLDFAGATVATTYVSPGRVTATVPATSLAHGGTYTLTMSNPAPSLGPSGSLTFTVQNPSPLLVSISPTSVPAGSTATLTVNGTSFVDTSEVEFAGTVVPTAYVSATQLVATIDATLIPTAGTYNVLVTSPAPGGGRTAILTLTTTSPGPTVTSITPASVNVNTQTTFTIDGSNFVGTTYVTVDGQTFTTTYVSPTRATITTSFSTGGYKAVGATTPPPGGGSSAATVTLTVNNAVPSISALTPAVVTAGAADFTLTIDGYGFVPGARATFDGTAVTTTYVSITRVTAAIPASLVTTGGTRLVAVENAAPDLGPSATFRFTVNQPVPVLTSITPASGAVGAAAFTLTLNGSSFISSSLVSFNNAVLTTTYVSATRLTAAVPAWLSQTAGAYPVTVANGGPGGGTSNALTYVVGTASPALAVAPTSLTFTGVAGGTAPAAQTLSVSNTGGGTLSWTASATGGSWLTISGTSGTAPGTVTVTCSQAGLAAGTYSGSVTVTSAGVTGSPVTVPVTFTVSAQSAGTELLRNGGFEGGTLTPWGRNGTASFYSASGGTPQAGTGYVYFGTVNSGSGQVAQQLTVPTTATTLTLSFWVRVSTTDTATYASDRLNVNIRNSTGTIVATPLSFTNLNATALAGWTRQSVTLTGYAGQTIRVTFDVVTDAQGPSTFSIDSVSLLAP